MGDGQGGTGQYLIKNDTLITIKEAGGVLLALDRLIYTSATYERA